MEEDPKGFMMKSKYGILSILVILALAALPLVIPAFASTTTVTFTDVGSGTMNQTTGTYTVGATVFVLATPSPYYHFDNFTWSNGTLLSMSNPASFTVTAGLTVDAYFDSGACLSQVSMSWVTLILSIVCGFAVIVVALSWMRNIITGKQLLLSIVMIGVFIYLVVYGLAPALMDLC